MLTNTSSGSLWRLFQISGSLSRAQCLFHKELLDLPHYRTLIEQDLSRTFGDALQVTTTVWPGPTRPRRRGAFNPTPA